MTRYAATESLSLADALVTISFAPLLRSSVCNRYFARVDYAHVRERDGVGKRSQLAEKVMEIATTRYFLGNGDELF